MRILIADDQPEVIRSLLAPVLNRPNESVVFSDAQSALCEVQLRAGYDVIFVDMHMPPGEWGGLDLIRWIRDEGILTPIIVVSGEGGQRETIQAMRLGADDWIRKEDAYDEVGNRLSELMREKRSIALSKRVASLPQLVASPFGAYQSKRVEVSSQADGAGLLLMAAVESTWRLASLIGLAEVRRQPMRLRGLRAGQLSKPSMGTYLELVRRLRRTLPDDAIARQLLDCYDLGRAQRVVEGRNTELIHGAVPALSPDARSAAEETLSVFLTRFLDWSPGRFATPDAMQFDGTAFRVTMRSLDEPLLNRFEIASNEPLTDGHVYWAGRRGILDCTPFFLMNEAGDAVAYADLKMRGDVVQGAEAMRYSVGNERATQPRGGSGQDILDCLISSLEE